jgi:hypothetical protein
MARIILMKNRLRLKNRSKNRAPTLGAFLNIDNADNDGYRGLSALLFGRIFDKVSLQLKISRPRSIEVNLFLCFDASIFF